MEPEHALPPTRYEDFPDPGDLPWLDRPDAEANIDAMRSDGSIGDPQAAALRRWCAQGWIVLEDFLVDDALIDAVNADVARKFAEHAGEELEDWKVELQNLFEQSAAVARLACEPTIVAWVDLLLGRPAAPFQTLNIPIGSQIPPHADQILMTTHPEGHMVAAWVALEDIDPASGPLLLWSGSHRLPYLSATAVGLPLDGDEAARGRAYDERYYRANEERIAAHGFEPHRYLPKRGQVLLWHSNVLHGGAPIERPGSSRRSLVVHYFARDVWQYSDLFNRPCPLPAIDPTR